MATTWGSYDGHLRYGIDLTTTTPSASSTTVTVTVKLYIQVSDDWRFDDNQTWTLSGPSGDSDSFTNTLEDGESKLLYSKSFSAGIDYDGGPTYSYSASLSGAYNGAKPTHSRSITLPRRPASAPSTPGAPTVGSIGSTTATATWSTPASNGASLTNVNGQVSRNSAFTSLVTTWSTGWANSRALSGLPKGTTLYVRIQAKNSVGWSAWSAARQFETQSTAASAPTLGAITGIGPQSATLAWAAPSDDGGETITGHHVQTAKDAGFTDGATTISRSASPATLTGLLPGTTYYVRVRAVTAYGAGAWSAVRSFTTLSGVRIGNGTAWVPALIYVGTGTQWVLATVKVGNGTGWR
ncbi:fibronectin type III domain-containing protein [Actinoplanes sp. NPDC049118]|uniref:fibronectin type III domain-containing protein n=1 Tax=Actinoplanes sp. NPDC049118 TaxID=3155769 RepID=UPI0034066247